MKVKQKEDEAERVQKLVQEITEKQIKEMKEMYEKRVADLREDLSSERVARERSEERHDASVRNMISLQSKERLEIDERARKERQIVFSQIMGFLRNPEYMQAAQQRCLGKIRSRLLAIEPGTNLSREVATEIIGDSILEVRNHADTDEKGKQLLDAIGCPTDDVINESTRDPIKDVRSALVEPLREFMEPSDFESYKEEAANVDGEDFEDIE